MVRTIGKVALLVHEYDEAINFYTQSLRFVVKEDTQLQNGKRWVVLSQPCSHGASLLLARASTLEQKTLVGNQAGDRVFLFLYSSDFWGDYEHMLSRGVKFLEEPRQEPYGWVVVFQDLYGNKWDLLQSM
jgi:predicted enzyme related to lactoylglutathione lyase